MTAQETPIVETTESVEETPSKKKFNLSPRVKRALAWGAAAVGLIAVTAIATAAATRPEDAEVDVYELEPLEDFTVTDVEITESTD